MQPGKGIKWKKGDFLHVMLKQSQQQKNEVGSKCNMKIIKVASRV